MTLTIKELETVASELDSALAGGTLRDVTLNDANTAVLSFATAGGDRTVLVCNRPRLSRIHLRTRSVPPRGGGPSPDFAAVARSELVGAAVEHVVTMYGDRVVSIDLRQGKARRRVLFECSGHHPNLFVVDEANVVLAMLAPSQSRLRDLRVGRHYQRPLRHPGDGIEAVRFLDAPTGISAQIEEHYLVAEEREARVAEVARVRQELRSALDHERRAAAAIGDDIERSVDAARVASAVRKVLSDPGLVKHGGGRVTVDVEGRPVHLQLDPRLPPAQDLSRLLARCERVAAARPGAERRLAETRAREATLGSALAGLEGGPEALDRARSLIRQVQQRPLGGRPPVDRGRRR